MTAGDLPAVLRLHLEAQPVLSSRRFLRRAYFPTVLDRAAGGLAWVAEDQGRPVAYVTGAADDARFHRRLLLGHPIEAFLALAARVARTGLHPSEAARLGGALPQGHPARRAAWIHWGATAPERRGRGLMGDLVRRFVAEASARSIPQCWARIEPGNDGSRRLHERIGFRLSGVDDPRGRVLLYRIELGGAPGERADQQG